MIQNLKLDFTKKLESTQYSAALAVSGAWRGVAWRGVAWRGVAWRGVAWRGTNTGKLYEELGWEMLYYRRWCVMIRDPSAYSLKYYCLRRPSAYEANVKSTERFSHTYFQYCLSL